MYARDKHELGMVILLLIGVSVLAAVVLNSLSLPLAIILSALTGAAITLLNARDR